MHLAAARTSALLSLCIHQFVPIYSLVIPFSHGIFLFSVSHGQRLTASKTPIVIVHVLGLLTKFCVALNATLYQFIIPTKSNSALFELTITMA